MNGNATIATSTVTPPASPAPARSQKLGASQGKPGPFKPKTETKPGRARKIKPPRFYYDKEKRQYWRETPHGEFVLTGETDLKRHCKLSGMLVGSFESNGLTAFEATLCKSQNEDAVDNVIAMAGHKSGVFHTQGGRKILVPRQPRVIAPNKGVWKNFESLLAELFGGKQLPYVLSWLKVALEDFRTLNPVAWHHHQMLALIGAPGCGKSFFQLLISLILGGRSTDPYLWMVGKSDFNEDLAESEHLLMEDKQPHRDAKSRREFASRIKQLTVSYDTPIHGKGKKQFNAPCFRRMTISVNADSDYITVLPMLDESINDKLFLVKCSKAAMLPDYAENRARFEREISAFVHYLLYEFEIPSALRHERFGVVHYHNPEVVELLQDFEPHLRFLEIVDATFFPDDNEQTITAPPTEIHRRLIDGPNGHTARQLLSYSSACGQLLARLEKELPSRFERSRTKGERRWTIRAPSK